MKTNKTFKKVHIYSNRNDKALLYSIGHSVIMLLQMFAALLHAKNLMRHSVLSRIQSRGSQAKIGTRLPRD